MEQKDFSDVHYPIYYGHVYTKAECLELMVSNLPYTLLDNHYPPEKAALEIFLKIVCIADFGYKI